MFIDEPQSLHWVRYDEKGMPLYYSRPHRFLADINHLEWRGYVKQRAQLALEAGFDAIFYDNLQAEDEGLKALLSEIQEMAVEHAHKTGKPKTILFVNAHLGPERLDINDIFEAVFNEFGRYTPGVWDGKWYVDNIRKTRYIKSDTPAWKPHFNDLSEFHIGDRLTSILSVKEEKLTIAEAAAFGSELGRCIEGRFVEDLIHRDAKALESWATIAHYNRFIRENESLYVGARPVRHVLLLTRTEPQTGNPFNDQFQRMLVRRSFSYEIGIVQRLSKREPSGRYGTVVVPPDIELTESLLKKLRPYMAQHAKLLVSRVPEGLDVNHVLYTSDEIAQVEGQAESRSLFQKVVGLAPQDTLEIDRPWILGSVMEIGGRKLRLVHVLNYAATPVSSVKITINKATRLPADGATLFSPDRATILAKVESMGGSLEIVIENLDTYAVLAIPYR